MKMYKIFQYPRGKNDGGILNANICPTISRSSWQTNCFLIEIEYEQSESDLNREDKQ